MSIKSTLVCDGCGRELTGDKGGVDERLDLLEIAVENGWACAFDHFCPECLASEDKGKAVEK